VDLFVHDSLHTRANILFELGTVTPFLSPSAVAIVDDIEGNSGFHEWAASAGGSFHAIPSEQKASLIGVQFGGAHARPM
jgi:hypothetical protein